MIEQMEENNKSIVEYMEEQEKLLNKRYTPEFNFGDYLIIGVLVLLTPIWIIPFLLGYATVKILDVVDKWKK